MIFWIIFIHLILINSIKSQLNDGTNKTSSINSLGTNSTFLDKCEDQKACCVPLVSCPAHVLEGNKSFCRISPTSKRPGVCCTTGQNHTGDSLERKMVGNLDMPTLTHILHESRVKLSGIRSTESLLLTTDRANAVLEEGSVSYSHHRNFRPFSMADLSEVMNVANRALEIAIATKEFKDRQGITNHQLEMGMMRQDLRQTPLAHACLPPPICPPNPERYRRLDGSCNNFKRPTWGASLTPYARLLPASYNDGIWAARFAVDKTPLPSPRLISTTVLSDNDVPNYENTLMVMQFGQFLSHDITRSFDATFANGTGISCCLPNGEGPLNPMFRHHACMPIQIPDNDEFYSHFGQKCMNFVRSVLAPRHDCTLGYAQQMNKVTHYIDCSSIYGSSPEQTSELRSFVDGKLNVFKDFGRDMLPLNRDPAACQTMEHGSACFTSGDTRTNQMISLVVLHLLFHREHNRLAQALSEINPHWNDEIIFLEARQILMAEMQVIIYKEFLPAVIGEDAMEEFRIKLGQGYDYANDYDEEIEASVTNEFATAAFRFGHSTVDGLLRIYGKKHMEEMISIPEVMFNPSRLRKKPFLDEILSTLTTEPLQEVDDSLSETMTKYMFRGGNPFGVDIASLNIQRGRDHGLRPYNDYRELSGLPRIKSFEEFGPIGEKLKKVYSSVDDIDLWIGGLLENKVPGGIVGPTFKDIIADQFMRLKRGDRYFFEDDPKINPGHFTPDQLNELRKASMSRIVCDNSDKFLLARLAPNAFKRPGVPGNEFQDCKGPGIPRMNLMFWQHKP